MDNKIATFLSTNKVVAYSTSVNDNPHSASCFYAAHISDSSVHLIFKSNRETKHITNALINPKISGTILPDVDKIGFVKGIQFYGQFIAAEGDFQEKIKQVYYKKFPFAHPMKGDVWAIELRYIKMTDNKLGFGKKLIWEKQ